MRVGITRICSVYWEFRCVCPALDPLEEAIFNAACGMADSGARAAFLYRACAHDTALRSRIEALLHADQQAIQFFDDDPLLLAQGQHSKRCDAMPLLVEPPQEIIGRYKLLQRIGEGGMGVD